MTNPKKLFPGRGFMNMPVSDLVPPVLKAPGQKAMAVQPGAGGQPVKLKGDQHCQVGDNLFFQT